MNKYVKQRGKESGITLIALIIMIVIIIILTSIVVGNLKNKGLIDVTSEVAENYEIVSYKEQIEQVVQSEIIAKLSMGEEATTISITDRLKEQEWIKSAILADTATDTEGNITVIVDKGYIYQVYYNSIYGKVLIDYIGKDDSGKDDDENVLKQLPKIIANFDKRERSIIVKANMPKEKNSIEKIEIFYGGKDKVAEKIGDIKDTDENSFVVNDTGWYKVVATSKDGISNYTWVMAVISSDGLNPPIITVAESGKVGKDEWYGSDNIPVIVEISSKNSQTKVEGIHYEIISVEVKEGTDKYEIVRNEYDTEDTIIKLDGISLPGTTKIIAYVKGENGKTSDVETLEVKYDNKSPILLEIEPKGIKEEGYEWFKGEVEIEIKNNVLEENSGVDGYYYRKDNEVQRHYVQDVSRTVVIEKERNNQSRINCSR